VVGLGIIRVVSEYTASVLDNGFRINGSCDGTTNVDFGHDFVDSRLDIVLVKINQTILGDSRIWKVINLSTSPSHPGKSITSAARVGLAASGVNIATKSILGFLTARHVGHASVVGNISSFLNKLKGRGVVTTMTRSGRLRTTVENKLNTQVNVIALALAGDLDAVTKTG
jgi:hypothetical protein